MRVRQSICWAALLLVASLFMISSSGCTPLISMPSPNERITAERAWAVVEPHILAWSDTAQLVSVRFRQPIEITEFDDETCDGAATGWLFLVASSDGADYWSFVLDTSREPVDVTMAEEQRPLRHGIVQADTWSLDSDSAMHQALDSGLQQWLSVRFAAEPELAVQLTMELRADPAGATFWRVYAGQDVERIEIDIDAIQGEMLSHEEWEDCPICGF